MGLWGVGIDEFCFDVAETAEKTVHPRLELVAWIREVIFDGDWLRFLVQSLECEYLVLILDAEVVIRNNWELLGRFVLFVEVAGVVAESDLSSDGFVHLIFLDGRVLFNH